MNQHNIREDLKAHGIQIKKPGEVTLESEYEKVKQVKNMTGNSTIINESLTFCKGKIIRGRNQGKKDRGKFRRVENSTPNSASSWHGARCRSFCKNRCVSGRRKNDNEIIRGVGKRATKVRPLPADRYAQLGRVLDGGQRVAATGNFLS